VGVQLAFIVAAGSLVYAVFFAPKREAANPPAGANASRRGEVPIPATPISLQGAALRGSDTAKIVILEYSDVQCPYCGKFARETFGQLDAKYINTGQVKFAFRHLPLGNHKDAQKAAEALECARDKGRFWDLHDRLFLNQERIGLSELPSHAEAVGLAPADFAACIGGSKATHVSADAESAKLLGIRVTPTFMLGTMQPDGLVRIKRAFAGAVPLANFEKAIIELGGTNLVGSN